MNAMWSEKLPVRVGTAAIGIILILAIMLYGGWQGMAVLALISAGVSLFEYFVMLFTEPKQKIQKLLGLGAGIVLAAAIIFRFSLLYETLGLVFLFLFVAYLILAQTKSEDLSRLYSDLALSLSGIFYISFLFSFWPKIRELETGVYWIFLVFVIPWISDSAAFFVGKKMGRHKLSPVISPHKTIEGSVAGFIFSVIAVFIYKLFFFQVLSVPDCIFLGLGGSLFSQGGDLFESFIKRAMGVKDSGVVIPGHGGVLDRFDSVLFCGLFVYFYANWWGAL